MLLMLFLVAERCGDLKEKDSGMKKSDCRTGRRRCELAQFSRYIGIDYSGAETPDSSCKGLRVYMAEGFGTPEPVQPPPSPRRYWTRRGLAEWLRNELDHDILTVVGIDHAFSFPLAYFERYRLSSNWQNFLVDFQHHWPTDARNTYVSFIRDGKSRGTGRTVDQSGEP